jgi:hypothetical protein
MALKTVALPTLIRLNKQVMVPVMPTLTTGTFKRGLTYPIAVAFGTAWSLAKAQSCLDELARVVIEAQQNIKTRHAERAVPPAVDREACVKISING